MNLGMAFWHRGMMKKAEGPLQEAVQAASESGNPYAEITARLFLSRIDAVRGSLLKAAAGAQKLMENPRGLPIELLALTESHEDSPTGMLQKWLSIGRLHEKLRAELGASVYGNAWERGQLLDLDSTFARLRETFGP